MFIWMFQCYLFLAGLLNERRRSMNKIFWKHFAKWKLTFLYLMEFFFQGMISFLRSFAYQMQAKRLQGSYFRREFLSCIRKKVSLKCKDPSSFTIPWTIKTTKFERPILHLRTSIHIMPYSILLPLTLVILRTLMLLYS